MGSKFYDILKNRIQDFYGNPEFREIELPSEIILEECVKTEHVAKEITIEVDNGPQPVMLVIAGVISLAGLLFLEQGLSIPIGFFIAGISLGILFFKKFRKRAIQKKSVREPVEKVEPVEVVNRKFAREILPGKKSIIKLGKGKLCFKVVEFRGEKYLLLNNGLSEETKLTIPTVEKPRDFFREFDNLEKSFQNIPLFLDKEKEGFEVEGEDQKVELKGIEARLMNHFFNVEYTMTNRKKMTISLPVIEGEQIALFAKKIGLISDYDDELSSFALSPDGEELDEALKAWQIGWPEKNDLLGKVRFDAVKNKILPEFIELGKTINYSSFNFYCPECNKQTCEKLLSRDYSVQSTKTCAPVYFAESTKCSYRIKEKHWKCPSCENVFNSPVPVHRMLDEILLPVYDQLMEENKIEREKDYIDVRKKEIFYRNEMKKETEQIFTQNFSSILRLKEEMEKMQAEIEGESEAISFMGETMHDYQGIQSEVIEKVENFNERLRRDVEASASMIRQEMDHYRDLERKLLALELAEIAKTKRLDDEKRDLVQREIYANLKRQLDLIAQKSDNPEQVIDGQQEIDLTNMGEVYVEKINLVHQSMVDLRDEVLKGNAITAAIAGGLGIPSKDASLYRIDRKMKKLIVDFKGPEDRFVKPDDKQTPQAK